MPNFKIPFLVVILFCSTQFLSLSMTIPIDHLQAEQKKDKEFSWEKECDFTNFKRRISSDFPGHDQEVKRVNPEYPELARQARITGKVIVKILIDRDGNVIRACPLTGHPLLKSAAATAALKWKFQAWCSRCGDDTFVESTIEFRFNSDKTTKGDEQHEKKS